VEIKMSLYIKYKVQGIIMTDSGGGTEIGKLLSI